MKKSLGVCPFCAEKTRAEIIESNALRRDKCLCEHCKEIIYVCRTPACEHYAKGGEIYDDEFCPSCIKSIPSVVAGTVAFIALVKSIL